VDYHRSHQRALEPAAERHRGIRLDILPADGNRYFGDTSMIRKIIHILHAIQAVRRVFR